jgi:signal transduction histidine kinase
MLDLLDGAKRKGKRDLPGSSGGFAIVLFSLLALAVGWAVLLYRVNGDRAASLEASRQQLAPLAKGLGLQIEAMAANGIGSAEAAAGLLRRGQSEAEASMEVAGMLTGGTYVRALFVLDEGKFIIANRPGERFSAGNMAWRTALLQERDLEWVGPVEAGTSGYAFPVARRVPGPEGRPQWVGALIGFEDLEEVYADLGQSRAYVSLVTMRGLMLRRLPKQQPDIVNLDTSASLMHRRFLDRPERSVTLDDGPQPDTGRIFQYAAYRVKGLPLITIAGRSELDALATWHAVRTSRVRFMALFSVVSLGLAVLLQLVSNRRWGDLRALAEARRAELQARESLASGLLLAQDAERKRLAGELHDGVGQTLSMLRNRMVMLRRAGLSPEAEAHAREAQDLATESISELRNMAHSLRPLHLEELGVTSALRALLERMGNSSDIAVHARVEDVDDVVRGPAAVHVYRIVQEAVNNVQRHAGATQMWVDVIRDIAAVEITVRDDGAGLPPEAQDGLGLQSIRERCRMLGATLDVETSGTGGTSVKVRLPIEAVEDADA